MLIDTHCHLSCKDYASIEDVIERMGDNIMIISGVDLESNQEVVELCSRYDNIYGTLGIHPEYANTYCKEDIEYIENHLHDPHIVGIGEIGLDYHYGDIHQNRQKELFICMLRLANQYQKTVVIHSRDSIEDTYTILKQYCHTKCIMHCYSSSLEMAYKFIDMGILLGIGGVVTFKNGKKLQKIVDQLDLRYLVLETDSPYLTPEPHRGERNEPSYVELVAQKIAEIKGISVSEVERITSNNAVCQFDLPIEMC